MSSRSAKIGRVEIFSEKMDAARDLSSCCVGVEAYLEADADRILSHPATPGHSTTPMLEKAFRRLIKAG